MTLKEYIDSGQGTITGIAREIKVSRQIIYDYVKGKSVPRLKTAYAIELLTGRKVTLYDWVKDAKGKKPIATKQTDIGQLI